MPLVRIDIGPGRPADFGRAVGDIVYRAMTTEINVPADDKFQIVTAHEATEINIPKSYLGIEYSEGIVFIQVTLNAGRTTELKKKAGTQSEKATIEIVALLLLTLVREDLLLVADADYNQRKIVSRALSGQSFAVETLPGCGYTPIQMDISSGILPVIQPTPIAYSPKQLRPLSVSDLPPSRKLSYPSGS